MRGLTITFTATIALCSLALGATTAQAAAPTILSTSFSDVTSSSVTLEAEVNPQSKLTKYRFEYGPGDCASSPCTQVPVPEGEIPPGGSPVPIGAEVKGLSPGSTYHFRVVAKSSGAGGGETKGPDTTFATYRLPQVFSPCPNDAFRTDKPSAELPDCRAYEQASPVVKDGADARGTVAYAKASVNGDAIGFVGSSPIPGADGSQEIPTYLASRDGGGWSTQGTLPPASSGDEAFVVGWMPDFSQVFSAANRFSGLGGMTLLSRGTADGSLTTLVPYGGGLKTSSIPSFAGASADGSQLFFESPTRLTALPASLEGKPNLYLWDKETNTVGLAGVFNDGTAPPEGAFAGSYHWALGTVSPFALFQGGAAATYFTQDQHAVTSEGSVYFTAGKTGQLYLRRNPSEAQSALNGNEECTEPAKACTIHVSATQKTNGIGGGPDPAGTRPAAFMAATPDGSKAFFTSSEKLTDDANTGPELPPPSIARANLSDGQGKNLSFLPAHAAGIASSGEHIYWANPEEGTIGRAKLDGDNPEIQPEFIVGAGHPQYVAVDSEHVYWTNDVKEQEVQGVENEGLGTIGRADVADGGNVKLDFIIGAFHPQGIAVDSEHVYWANAGDTQGNADLEDATRTIGRAKLDGGEVDQTFMAFGNGQVERRPQGIAVNVTHIYVAAHYIQNGKAIYRYDIDGNLSSGKGFNDLEGADVRGIALDAGHVYWARHGTNAIGRANLDLEEQEPKFITDADHPFGLAFDATHIYWSANQGTPPNPGNDLYRFDADTGELSDLAPDASDVNGAEVLGVLGTSDDGSYVYFAANGDLDGAGPASGGDCKGSFGDTLTGECSLYLAREGFPIAFVARLDANNGGASDAVNWLPFGFFNQKTARVSPDGRVLLFRSQEKLTSYDNEGTAELYRYRVGDPGPTCVSCNPTGAAPVDRPSLGSARLSNIFPAPWSFVLSRNLSADGNRVFFETTDALVGADTNGEGGCPEVGPTNSKYRICLDVYEWEAKGTGSCEEDVQGGGCLYLLSTGKSPDASHLADASGSGDDVFLFTRSPLVRQDEDQLYDVYDASVGGGLASQNEVEPVPCEAEGCRPGASAPPASQSPGSASFSGPADPKPKAKRKHKKARHKRKHRKTQRRHHEQHRALPQQRGR